MRSLGFNKGQIVEEYGVVIKGKRYIVDLAAFAKTAEDPSGKIIRDYSIAIECGDTSLEKIEALKTRFNDVVHVDVGYVVESYLKVSSQLNKLRMETKSRFEILQVEIGQIRRRIEELEKRIGTR